MKLGEASRHPDDAGRKTEKTSSLKLKEAKIGILLPKLSVVPAGDVSKTKSIASRLQAARSVPSVIMEVASSEERINS